jgi:bifunctional enzyme CysN/CysC
VQNRATGSFVIVDSLSNNTVGAGMIIDDAAAAAQDLDAAMREVQAGSDAPARTQVSPRERGERLGQRGAAVLLRGGEAQRTRLVAFALERRLWDLGHAAHVVDGNGEPAAAVALAVRACADAGLLALCAGAGEEGAGEALRARVGAERLVEATVDEGSVDAAVERIVALLAERGQLQPV